MQNIFVNQKVGRKTKRVPKGDKGIDPEELETESDLIEEVYKRYGAGIFDFRLMRPSITVVWKGSIVEQGKSLKFQSTDNQLSKTGLKEESNVKTVVKTSKPRKRTA